MTRLKIIFFLIIAAVIVNFFVCSAVKAKTGNAKRGKILFSDPKIGDSSTADSCNSCHFNGNGLEKSGEKKEFIIMGSKIKSLEAAVNLCISNVLKGKELDFRGNDMADIAAYIKSFWKKEEGSEKKQK